jgi:hypothetical protein
MWRRLSLIAAGVMLIVGVCSAQKPGGQPGKKPEKQGAPPAGFVTVNGPVKGAPSGSTFVIANRKGTTTVDASKAQVRFRGKFSNVAAIKPGSMVEAKGSMSGATLMATEVNISHIPGTTSNKPEGAGNKPEGAGNKPEGAGNKPEGAGNKGNKPGKK